MGRNVDVDRRRFAVDDPPRNDREVRHHEDKRHEDTLVPMQHELFRGIALHGHEQESDEDEHGDLDARVDDAGTNCDEVTAPFAAVVDRRSTSRTHEWQGIVRDRVALRSGIKVCTEVPVIAHEEMRLGCLPSVDTPTPAATAIPSGQ